MGPISMGGNGSKAITGTAAVTPPSGYYFYCIDFTEDSKVSEQVDLSGSSNAVLSTLPIIPAKPIYVDLTSITLSSGSAIGYFAKLS